MLIDDLLDGFLPVIHSNFEKVGCDFPIYRDIHSQRLNIQNTHPSHKIAIFLNNLLKTWCNSDLNGKIKGSNNKLKVTL